MPKKTKKEKIIAEYRRKLQTVAGTPPTRKEETHQAFVTEKSPRTSSVQPVYQLDKQQNVSEKGNSETSTIELHDLIAIRHDLIKTVLLAAATISVELLLYWRIGK